MDSSTSGTNTYRGGQFAGWKGSESGQDSKYKVDDEEKDWQDYKKEKKLSFAAQKKQHQKDFDAWRKGRKTQTGTPIIKTGM